MFITQLDGDAVARTPHPLTASLIQPFAKLETDLNTLFHLSDLKLNRGGTVFHRTAAIAADSGDATHATADGETRLFTHPG